MGAGTESGLRPSGPSAPTKSEVFIHGRNQDMQGLKRVHVGRRGGGEAERKIIRSKLCPEPEPGVSGVS